MADAAGPASDLATLAAGFGRLLRQGGVPVTADGSARFAAAVELAAPYELAELYWLGRVTLVSAREQVPAYDAAFAQVFGGLADVADFRGQPPEPAASPTTTPDVPPETRDRRPPAGPEPPRTVETAQPTPGAGAAEPGEQVPVAAAASSVERLRHQHFAGCTAEELAQITALVDRIRLRPPLRPARRRRVHRSGRRLDLRRTLRGAHRTGGDPVRRVYRLPASRPRRVVLLADVSGSMEPYARVYLHLLHGAVRAARAEAFVFATRLTRVTRPLALGQPDLALAAATAAVRDWSGGTRIGAAVKTFLDDFGRRGMARQAVVVVVSDGWERDDPALLGEQMARLGRLAHRVVWVNPRSARTGFAPLTGGMAAARPHVDLLVPGHSVHALDEVVAAIGGAH